MNLDNFNSLIELFFYQTEKQNPKDVFLQWLNPNNKKTFTWEEVKINIFKLSKIIKKNITEGDRCLLVSENRPEWFIADLAIMLSGGITVPAYTTYTEDDYKYLIEDCEPTVVIVSNNEMLKKLNITINEKNFIKKVITFDEVEKACNNLNIDNKEKYLDFNSIIKNDLSEKDKIQNLNLKRSSAACIIYTSGTGGNPKGVILSHGGILNNLVGACEIMKPLKIYLADFTYNTISLASDLFNKYWICCEVLVMRPTLILSSNAGSICCAFIISSILSGLKPPVVSWKRISLPLFKALRQI